MAFKVNELQRDEFGRVHGILGVNKPADMTSHDVVNIVRRELKTRKVGHAGALDPFATGVLIILVGKATKLSDNFINSDKEYIAKTLFGIQTDSADIEGKILEVDDNPDISGLAATLTKFSPEYDQFVPVYSSIKVNGDKLRVLARQATTHEVVEKDSSKFAIFHFDDKADLEVELPVHNCKIPEIEIVGDQQEYSIENDQFYLQADSKPEQTIWPTVDIRVSCSKGTYIRTLAEDIGKSLPSPTPSMLVGLTRTRVDRIHLEHAIELDELAKL